MEVSGPKGALQAPGAVSPLPRRRLARLPSPARINPRAGVVAVMQPYFYPYPGYYRLLAAAETLVLFDCVQFPRRGRVHRAGGLDTAGRPRWLTLPIARAPRATAIKDLQFQGAATDRFKQRIEQTPWLAPVTKRLPAAVLAHLHAPLVDVVDYLEAGLRAVGCHLGLETRILRSSSLPVDPALRGQATVIVICEALGAKAYVNPPGGRALYDPAAFRARGLALSFLSPYAGTHATMLQAMAAIEPGALRRHLTAGAALVQ